MSLGPECTDPNCAAHGTQVRLKADNVRLAREVAELEARLNAAHDEIRRLEMANEQLRLKRHDGGKML